MTSSGDAGVLVSEMFPPAGLAVDDLRNAMWSLLPLLISQWRRQSEQNMNLMFGFVEAAGLWLLLVLP